MINLATNYMGVALKNPIIAGASSMSSDLDMLKKLEKAGAAAIIYKTLFEEQINLESAQFDDQLEAMGGLHAEMTSLYPKLQHAGPEAHLVNLRKAKESLSIPVFASLNCLYDNTWIEYARLIEKTGVDGIELNFYFVPGDFEADGRSIEDIHLDLVKTIKSKITIPVSVKLSSFYSNPLNFISRLDKAGVNAVVIFNRMFEPEINVQEIKHVAPFYLSHEGDYRLALRYAGLLYGNMKANVCANTGIYQGNDVIKMILAGADCVQVVSTLYKNKPEHIATMLSDMETWMESKKFTSIADFKGKLSKKELKDPFIYKRGQYIDLLLGSDQLIK
ncbi:MAG: dihydroorotate dehydrogenase-like protein [Bacteroidales bacterium]|nr:dihydroorotate dehydrogenase-like protein [Bacteroidales bacterium]